MAATVGAVAYILGSGLLRACIGDKTEPFGTRRYALGMLEKRHRKPRADPGGKDVFVYISAVEKAGLSNLNEGAKVSYEVVANRGKESAENLRMG